MMNLKFWAFVSSFTVTVLCFGFMMNLQNRTASHNRCRPNAAVTILIASVCPLALTEGVSDTWKKILRKTVAFLRRALSTMLLMAHKTTLCWKT